MEFRIIFIYLIVGISAAPQFIVYLEQTVPNTFSLQLTSPDWLSDANRRFEEQVGGAEMASHNIQSKE